MKKALVTGIAGQDGSYLAEYLYSLGYEVHGTVRSEVSVYQNLKDYFGKVYLYYCDLRDEVSIENVIRKVHPDEIYNLAGQVFVPTSWDQPGETFDINVGGLSRILKCVDNFCRDAKVYQASSSEMYGNALSSGNKLLSPDQQTAVLHELSKMSPATPYAVSKLAAHKLIDAYRQKGHYVVSGILFNHESPRRGPEMVTRKITRHIADWVVTGERPQLKLGDVYSRRDWGFAGDYVRAMHAMLQQPYPDDYVVGTGESHSVYEFVQASVSAAGLDWDVYKDLVVSNCGEFKRKNELKALVADYSKANKVLGWQPTVNFLDLVKMMVDSDVNELQLRRAHEPTSSAVAVGD